MSIWDCNATACRARSSPTRQIDLVVAGDTMQAQLLSPSFPNPSDPVAVKLQRVQ
jgi:hypothetical protein